MQGRWPIVGVVSFADSRKDQALAAEAIEYIRGNHNELVKCLRGQGFKVIDPNSQLAKARGDHFVAITVAEARDFCVRELQRQGAECVVICCWRWSEPMPIVDLVRRLNIPVALFSRRDADWSGFGGITAIGAALWEIVPNHSALVHARIREDKEELVKWIKGVTAYRRLRKANLLLWGGIICQGMEHLLDDISKLKSFLIGDILNEGQYYLIKRAENFLRDGKEIQNFLDWLQRNGTKIVYDAKMLTPKSLAKQVALYLAAEQRLEELGRENIDSVSVLCHRELSVEYGVTPCLIPALLPFGENHKGTKPMIPTVCEGDVKGLITCLLLSYLEPGVPPLFGDLREIRDQPNWIVIGNCGGASLYYANNSPVARNVLPKVILQPQVHGISGAAVSFSGRSGGLATVARLVRVKGRYWMQAGIGETIEVTEEIMARRKWGKEWPTVIVNMGVSADEVTKVAGSNHYCLIPGDHVQELTYACREAGIPTLRIDSKEDISMAISEMTRDDHIQKWNPY